MLLHEINLHNPSIAVIQIIKEIINMGYDALNNVRRSLDLILNYDPMISQNLLIIENDINHYEKEITESLVKLSNTEINEHQSKIIAALYHIINDIERIGDHAENLYELAEHKYKNSLIFSDEAIVEIKFMYQYVIEAVDLALSSLKDGDLQKAMKTIELESKIDKLDKQLRNGHIDRLNTGICYPESGAIFLDIISNLERIGDHANNIAQLVIEINRVGAE
ncbi:Na/Pi cotransporter family protein [Caloramator sp. Dgby_cultured_2]|uniref:Na/Pi cotransporter family protein n=1 Tax=Caloramator sp. Dgby_cultured_2 TaxID=3029174 RepID=UPI00237E75C1|nr:PhoU domain-containing protein [Caloramator sp. Dgby_cultured_2]WDU83394.1 PhoU domain-containing protein [Caloramator sp. Dgby_cultured_2]